jgi:hypothetical protein
MGHIFISYSHKDTDYAHGLANNLQSMGFEVWIDARLDYGSQWPHEIQKQLDACDAFIIIMSPRSFASEWVQSELQRAKRKLKPIFPLLLEGDEPWLSIESTQFFDVRGGRFPDDKFYSALKRVVSISHNTPTLQFSKQPVKTGFVAAPSVPQNGKGIGTAVMVAVMAVFVVCVGVSVVLFRGGLFPVSMAPSPLPATAILTLPSSPTEQATVTLPPILSLTETLIPTLPPPTLKVETPTSIPPTDIPTATLRLNTSVYIEAEDGIVGKGAYSIAHKTASKNLYVIFPIGGTLKLTISDFAAGQYNLVIHYIKYVNGTPDYSDPGYQYLYVNGDGPTTITYFKTMGDEDGDNWKWKDQSVTIFLKQGTNTLLIENGYPGVSIDYIYISQ